MARKSKRTVAGGGSGPGGTVTRDDIEAKMKEISGEVESTSDTAKPFLLMAGIGGIVLLVVLAYILGRRKGKKKTTVVEIRRV